MAGVSNTLCEYGHTGHPARFGKPQVTGAMEATSKASSVFDQPVTHW
jgi:hypothetical protein